MDIQRYSLHASDTNATIRWRADVSGSSGRILEDKIDGWFGGGKKKQISLGSDERVEIAPLEITGTIQINGDMLDGEGKVPSQIFFPLVQQAIEERANRERSMSPSRSRILGAPGP